MGSAAVDDVRLPYAPPHRSKTGLHLGDHAGVEVGQERLQRVHADARDQRALVGPAGVEALDVGEHDELLGPHGDGDGGGGRIGIDVQDGGRVRHDGRDRRDDGNAALVEQFDDAARIDIDDVADQPDVDSLPVDGGQALAGAQHPPVLTGDPHRRRVGLVEEGDELALDRAGEHHAHDIHDLRGGHAQPALELRGDTQALEHRTDLRSAAVEDDRPQPHLVEEEDIGREGPLEALVDHGVAAVLDDDGRALVGAQPRHRLQEDGCLLVGGRTGGRNRAAGDAVLSGCGDGGSHVV